MLVGEAEQELGGDMAFDAGSTGSVDRRTQCWRDTAISLPIDAPDRWRNVFTDQHHQRRAASATWS